MLDKFYSIPLWIRIALAPVLFPLIMVTVCVVGPIYFLLLCIISEEEEAKLEHWIDTVVICEK